MTTTAGEPREHILPEGLGNTEHILRRGLVCGKCNNYFASKVEKPFLELPEIVNLRFEQYLPSKKGRIPSITGVLLDSILPVEVARDADTGHMSVYFSEEAVRSVTTFERGRIIIPISKLVAPGPITSRFVGKAALEALAYRIQDNEVFLEEMIENSQLDDLRRHVRSGEIPDWPISVRRIYDANDSWYDGNGPNYQIVHEFDFLHLDNGEYYFILALFGQELVINMGGPGLDGWNTWCQENGATSPLQLGRGSKREIKI